MERSFDTAVNEPKITSREKLVASNSQPLSPIRSTVQQSHIRSRDAHLLDHLVESRADATDHDLELTSVSSAPLRHAVRQVDFAGIDAI